jgi:tripartite-type tricarboxylate transporter receptor subunit TctC
VLPFLPRNVKRIAVLRNTFLLTALLAALHGGFGAAACAADYPSRPVRLVVAFPPGGNVDVFARLLARQVESQIGQQIVVDNRAGGANGIVGYDIVAKAPPDGYTLLSAAFAFVVNPALYDKLPYDTEKDFVPITNFVLGLGYVLTVNAGVPAQSVRELIALAKGRSEPLRYSSAGIGNGQHLAAELFRLKAGIPLLHVPYKGGGPALNAVISGETQISFPSPIPVAPHVKSGRVRALGFTGDTRVSLLPDVPTIAEAGLPGFKFDAGWHAWFAPARTPPAIVNRVYAEIRKALEDPKLREVFIAGGYEPKGDPPVEFQKTFRADIRHYAEIVKAANIKAQ